MKACMYTRTSSATNVDGDSKERQQIAIMQYAEREGIQIVAQASDDAVKGADPIGARKGLSRLLDFCITNEDVRIILVERADRFSRDQVVQEMGYLEMSKHGIEIIPVDAPGYFTLDPTPSQTMIRQILGAVAQFEKENRLLEAQRLKQRTDFDIEMIREVGFCSGIENYSRYFDGRKVGEPPYTLLDFLPSDAICFIDESHQTLPQIRAMYNGDRQRKSVLVDYGFR